MVFGPWLPRLGKSLGLSAFIICSCACGFFPYRFCTDSDSSKCSSCKKFRPFVNWDFHSLCPACRDCSKDRPCNVCRSWTSKEWDLLRQRAEERGKSIPKRKKGAKQSQPTNSPSKKSKNRGSGSSKINPGPKDKSGIGSAQSDLPEVQMIESGIGSATACLPRLPRSRSQENSSPGLTLTPDTRDVRDSRDASSGLPTVSIQGNAPLDTALHSSAPTAVTDQLQRALLVREPSDANALVLSSDMNSNITRDFEGFSDRSRSRDRSRSKKKRRRRHSSSSSSSSPSMSRRHRRRHRQPEPASFPTEAISQLVNLLSQSVERFSPQAPATSSTAISGPTQPTDPTVEPLSDEENDFPDEARSLASQEDFFLHTEARVNSGESDDDIPLMGTSISKEAFDKAVEVIRRQLGFDASSPSEPSSSRKSHLSLNKPVTPLRSSMPVDAECFDRFEAQAKAKKWRAYPKRQASDFHIDDEDWKAFFSSPSLPDVCLDKLKASGAVDHRGKFRTSSTKKSYLSLQGIDLAARTGMKFASSLLLIAEVLSKSFRQTGTEEVSRKDTGALVNILGPVARLSYDQFAKVAVKASSDRRELVLDSIRWPSDDIKRRFMELPLSGPDLFAGKFEEQLLTEIKRRKDINKADFNFPRSSSSSTRTRRSSPKPSFRRPSRPSAFPSRQQSIQGRSRDRPRIQAPGRNYPKSTSTNFSRRPLRGSSRGGSRGFGRSQSKP